MLSIVRIYTYDWQNREKREMRKNDGFSLIELIIVIAIMAVLVAVIAPNLASYLGTSKKRSDETNADETGNVITYIVQGALVDDDEKEVAQNIIQNYNERILRVDKMIADVDSTGAFKQKVEKQLSENEFKCKRQDYNYYVQVIIESGEVYEVICRSIHATADELAEWP